MRKQLQIYRAVSKEAPCGSKREKGRSPGRREICLVSWGLIRYNRVNCRNEEGAAHYQNTAAVLVPKGSSAVIVTESKTQWTPSRSRPGPCGGVF